ncbi:MAG: Flp pilus assembly protein CpaB [Desulfobacterales bacterium]
MKNWKAGIPIIIALVIALTGSALIYDWLKKQTTTVEVVKIESEAIPLVVAGIDLPAGTKLIPEMMKSAPYFKESVPTGSFTKLTDLNGRIVIGELKKGEVIVEHRLASSDITMGGISAILKPGKRAIAVRGDKVIGISGFVNPGNNVDILVTLTDPVSKTQKTKLVLENILILATGTQIQKNAKGDPAPIDVYTLEVTPEEGEKLALSASEGKLQFALRNMMDSETVSTTGATIPQTLASLKQAEPATKPVRNKKPKVWKPQTMSVEIIKGDKQGRKSVKS